jgi:hypothetical protein
MADKDVKEIIKLEYENGKTMQFLADKYGVKLGTIKTWSFTQKWIKKKPNNQTKPKKKSKNQKVKPNQENEKSNNIEIEIKKDILNEMPRQEVMDKYGIKKSAYYVKKKSISELILERSEMYLRKASEFAYPDAQELLQKIKIKKRNILLGGLQSISLDTLNKSEQETLSKALANITKIENEIMKDLGIVSIYKQIETDNQINDIDIQKEKLEIEKVKVKELINSTNDESVTIIDDITGE